MLHSVVKEGGDGGGKVGEGDSGTSTAPESTRQEARREEPRRGGRGTQTIEEGRSESQSHLFG